MTEEISTPRPRKARKTTAVVVHQAPPAPVAAQPDGSVESFISQAIAQNAPVETLERLFALHEKVDAKRAKAAFTEAMMLLQAELPVVKKLKAGHVAAFAPLEDVLEVTGPFISKRGFSYRWNTSQESEIIKVSCIATHKDGHSESVEMSAPIEEIVTGNASGKATKSSPQRVASTITFLKRYTFINLFGINIAGEDFDGRMQKQKPSAAVGGVKDVKSRILFLLRALKADVSTAEKIKEAIKHHTGLESKADTHEEIASRLQHILDENNES